MKSSNLKLLFQISLVGLVGFVVLVLQIGVQTNASLSMMDAFHDKAQSVEARSLVEQVRVQALEMRRREKDFLIGGKPEDTARHDQHMSRITETLEAMGAHPTLASRQDAVARIASGLQAYKQGFGEVARLKQEVGVNEKSGLLGALRGSVHAVEKVLKQHNQDGLSVIMLMMRRHEKDFLARLQPKYVARMAKRESEFAAALAESGVPEAERPQITALMQAYLRDFRKMADARLRLAAKAGEIDTLYAATEPVVASLVDELKQITDAASAEAETITTTAFGTMIAVALASLLALVLGTVLVARRITRPIETLTATMDRLAHDDFEIALPEAERGDEIGAMAKAVAVFRESGLSRHALEEAKAHEDEETARVHRRQADAIERFSADVGEILETVSRTAQELNKASDSLRDTASQSRGQSDAVSQATSEAATSIQTVAAGATELSASIQEISTQVQSNSRVAETARRRTEETRDRVASLEQSSGKIGEIVALIQDIAEQTNLLALNATIEAARAGESGKGFAVVASEVKNLANETASATVEIGRQVDEIQSETGVAVENIRGIAEQVDGMSEMATVIAAAVEQQSAASREISVNIESTAASTQDVSKNVDNVARSVRSTDQTAGQVTSAADDLNRATTDLDGAIQRFLGELRQAA